jgi:uncharacterized protein YifE (UPF0438 family)
MTEVYVDPPQLVTAGYELADASDGLRELRDYAERRAVAGIRNSRACEGYALTVFEESWQRYTYALYVLAEVVQLAGSHTLAAADHYTDTDRCSAGLIERVWDGRS